MAQKAPTERLTRGTRPEPLRMTFEEFLAWDAEGMRAEWVDGEVAGFWQAHAGPANEFAGCTNELRHLWTLTN